MMRIEKCQVFICKTAALAGDEAAVTVSVRGHDCLRKLWIALSSHRFLSQSPAFADGQLGKL